MTWSKSQVSNLKECRRKYFFAKISPDEAQPLKKLQSRYLWGGALVHETIGTLLKLVRQGETLPPLEQTLHDLRLRMRQEFQTSKGGEAKLFEHFYNVPVNQEAWKSQWANIEKSLTWFYGSRWLARFQELEPHTWKVVDELLDFEVDGVKSYVKMDCALETNGRFVLIDWKTSAPKPSDEFALQVMALYAHDVWDADVEAIDAMSVSLVDGRQFKATISEDSLMETQMRIQEETALLAEEAAQQETYADYKAAPMTSDTGACLRCNFQKICHPAGVSMAYAV